MDLGTGISELARKVLKRQQPPLPNPPPVSPIVQSLAVEDQWSEQIIDHSRPTSPIESAATANTASSRGSSRNASPRTIHSPTAGTETSAAPPVEHHASSSDNIWVDHDRPTSPITLTHQPPTAASIAPQPQQPMLPKNHPLVRDGGATDRAAGITTSRVIRFRVVKLSSTGMYNEKLLSLDILEHRLQFQDPSVLHDPTLPTSRLLDHKRGFAISMIKAFMPFDDTSSASAPMPGSTSYTARLLILFQPELQHRSYEIVFTDQVQRNVFLALISEEYGIEILQCEEAPQRDNTFGHPKWIPDGAVSACMACTTPFTLLTRKHHCRACGGIFCGPCSEHNASLPDLSYSKPVRVCNACFRIICDVRKQGLMIPGVSSSSSTSTTPATMREEKMNNQTGSKSDSDPSASPRTVIRPVFVQPNLSRATSNPIASDPYATPLSASTASPTQTPNQPQNGPPRDIYGFLLSSPTLALTTTCPAPRDQTVMHVQHSPNNSLGGNDDSTFTTSAASGEDLGFSTINSAATPNSTSSAAAALHNLQQQRLAAQNVEFEASRERWNKYLVLHTTIDRHSPELRRLVRKGIPPELRGQIWQILSGSREKQVELQQAHARRYQQQLALPAPPINTPPSKDNIVQANYYQHCLACSQVPANVNVSIAEIDKDLHRTFPDNVLYESVPNSSPSGPTSPTSAASPKASTPTSPGLAMLRRVLLAYSFHCPSIGYCQSMNFVTALLLLFMDEEDAFYMLIVILEDLCCIEVNTGEELDAHDGSMYERTKLYYHSPDLAGAHIDSKVFIDLIHEKLPKIAAQFDKLSFPLAPLSMSWLLCLFLNTTPLETTLVIWDILFNEGVKILMRASLTLLKVHEKHILKAADFEELLLVLKSCPAFHTSIVQGSNGVDVILPPQCDTAAFIRACHDPLWLGSFKMSRVVALRNFHRLQVEAELSLRKEKLRASRERTKNEKEKKEKGGGTYATMTSAMASAAASAVAAISSSVAPPANTSDLPRSSPAVRVAPPIPPRTAASTAYLTQSPQQQQQSPPQQPHPIDYQAISVAATIDPSVQFARTSGGSNSGLDPRFADRVDLYTRATHLPAGVIEGFYSSPIPPVHSPAPAHQESDYVAIVSPRPPIPARSPTKYQTMQASISTPQSPPTVERPENALVKNALKRAVHGAKEEQAARAEGMKQQQQIHSGITEPTSAPLRQPSTPTSLSSAPSSTHARHNSASPPKASTTSTTTVSGTTPQSPSMLSSVLSGVSKAFQQVTVLLSEDERLISQRANETRTNKMTREPSTPSSSTSSSSSSAMMIGHKRGSPGSNSSFGSNGSFQPITVSTPPRQQQPQQQPQQHVRKDNAPSTTTSMNTPPTTTNVPVFLRP